MPFTMTKDGGRLAGNLKKVEAFLKRLEVEHKNLDLLWSVALCPEDDTVCIRCDVNLIAAGHLTRRELNDNNVVEDVCHKLLVSLGFVAKETGSHIEGLKVPPINGERKMKAIIYQGNTVPKHGTAGYAGLALYIRRNKAAQPRAKKGTNR